MFRWYQQAHYCCARLHDLSKAQWSATHGLQSFQRSGYFDRGWTLQELIAPDRMMFITSDWHLIGYQTHVDLIGTIATTTRVPPQVLNNYRTMQKIPVEDRVRWLLHRTTLRTEDMAYCLLGICE